MLYWKLTCEVKEKNPLLMRPSGSPILVRSLLQLSKIWMCHLEKKILKIVRLHGDYFQKVAAMVFYAYCAWRFKKSIWCVSPTSRLCVPFMLSKSPATPYVMEKKKSHGAYHSWMWVVEIKWCLLLLECVAAVFGESSCSPWRL